VEKEKIAENGEYNLSGERYRNIQNIQNIQSNYDFVKIGDIFKTASGGTPLKSKEEYYINGTIPWLRSGEVAQGYIYNSELFITESGLKNSSAKIFPINTVLVAMYGATAGQVGLLKIEAATNQAICGILPNEKVNAKYVFLVLKSQTDYMISLSSGGAQPNISQKIIRDLKIPLPPLSVQEEIVAEIESYQKIINGAHQVVENYKPKIDIDPEWELVELSKICDINKETANPSDLYSDWFNYLDISTVENGTGKINYDNVVKVEDSPSRARRLVQQHDILLSTVRPNLKAFGYVDVQPNRFIASTGFAVLTAKKDIIEPRFLYFMVFQESVLNQMINRMGKGSYPSINQKDVNELQIALPSMEVQKEIINQLEIEQKSIFYNEKLIEIYEQKIKNRIAKVWGE
jgi:type I restriction enzyme M protein